jgi:hypothetical protein
MAGATPLMEKRLLDLASLMFVTIGSLFSSFAMLSGGLSHSPGAKLSINNDAPSLLRHKEHFADSNVCGPRQLGR